MDPTAAVSAQRRLTPVNAVEHQQMHGQGQAATPPMTQARHHHHQGQSLGPSQSQRQSQGEGQGESTQAQAKPFEYVFPPPFLPDVPRPAQVLSPHHDLPLSLDLSGRAGGGSRASVSMPMKTGDITATGHHTQPRAQVNIDDAANSSDENLSLSSSAGCPRQATAGIVFPDPQGRQQHGALSSHKEHSAADNAMSAWPDADNRQRPLGYSAGPAASHAAASAPTPPPALARTTSVRTAPPDGITASTVSADTASLSSQSSPHGCSGRAPSDPCSTLPGSGVVSRVGSGRPTTHGHAHGQRRRSSVEVLHSSPQRHSPTVALPSAVDSHHPVADLPPPAVAAPVMSRGKTAARGRMGRGRARGAALPIPQVAAVPDADGADTQQGSVDPAASFDEAPSTTDAGRSATSDNGNQTSETAAAATRDGSAGTATTAVTGAMTTPTPFAPGTGGHIQGPQSLPSSGTGTGSVGDTGDVGQGIVPLVAEPPSMQHGVGHPETSPNELFGATLSPAQAPPPVPLLPPQAAPTMLANYDESQYEAPGRFFEEHPNIAAPEMEARPAGERNDPSAEIAAQAPQRGRGGMARGMGRGRRPPSLNEQSASGVVSSQAPTVGHMAPAMLQMLAAPPRSPPSTSPLSASSSPGKSSGSSARARMTARLAIATAHGGLSDQSTTPDSDARYHQRHPMDVPSPHHHQGLRDVHRDVTASMREEMAASRSQSQRRLQQSQHVHAHHGGSHAPSPRHGHGRGGQKVSQLRIAVQQSFAHATAVRVGVVSSRHLSPRGVGGGEYRSPHDYPTHHQDPQGLSQPPSHMNRSLPSPKAAPPLNDGTQRSTSPGSAPGFDRQHTTAPQDRDADVLSLTDPSLEEKHHGDVNQGHRAAKKSTLHATTLLIAAVYASMAKRDLPAFPLAAPAAQLVVGATTASTAVNQTPTSHGVPAATAAERASGGGLANAAAVISCSTIPSAHNDSAFSLHPAASAVGATPSPSAVAARLAVGAFRDAYHSVSGAESAFFGIDGVTGDSMAAQGPHGGGDVSSSGLFSQGSGVAEQTLARAAAANAASATHAIVKDMHNTAASPPWATPSNTELAGDAFFGPSQYSSPLGGAFSPLHGVGSGAGPRASSSMFVDSSSSIHLPPGGGGGGVAGAGANSGNVGHSHGGRALQQYHRDRSESDASPLSLHGASGGGHGGHGGHATIPLPPPYAQHLVTPPSPQGIAVDAVVPTVPSTTTASKLITSSSSSSKPHDDAPSSTVFRSGGNYLSAYAAQCELKHTAALPAAAQQDPTALSAQPAIPTEAAGHEHVQEAGLHSGVAVGFSWPPAQAIVDRSRSRGSLTEDGTLSLGSCGLDNDHMAGARDTSASPATGRVTAVPAAVQDTTGIKRHQPHDDDEADDHGMTETPTADVTKDNNDISGAGSAPLCAGLGRTSSERPKPGQLSDAFRQRLGSEPSFAGSPHAAVSTPSAAQPPSSHHDQHGADAAAYGIQRPGQDQFGQAQRHHDVQHHEASPRQPSLPPSQGHASLRLGRSPSGTSPPPPQFGSPYQSMRGGHRAGALLGCMSPKAQATVAAAASSSAALASSRRLSQQSVSMMGDDATGASLVYTQRSTGNSPTLGSGMWGVPPQYATALTTPGTTPSASPGCPSALQRPELVTSLPGRGSTSRLSYARTSSSAAASQCPSARQSHGGAGLAAGQHTMASPSSSASTILQPPPGLAPPPRIGTSFMDTRSVASASVYSHYGFPGSAPVPPAIGNNNTRSELLHDGHEAANEASSDAQIYTGDTTDDLDDGPSGGMPEGAHKYNRHVHRASSYAQCASSSQHSDKGGLSPASAPFRDPAHSSAASVVSAHGGNSGAGGVNARLPHSPSQAQRVVLTEPSDMFEHVHSDGQTYCVDNRNGDLVLFVGMVLLERYEVIRILGCGTYGQVVLCRDLRVVEAQTIEAQATATVVATAAASAAATAAIESASCAVSAAASPKNSVRAGRGKIGLPPKKTAPSAHQQQHIDGSPHEGAPDAVRSAAEGEGTGVETTAVSEMLQSALSQSPGSAPRLRSVLSLESSAAPTPTQNQRRRMHSRASITSTMSAQLVSTLERSMQQTTAEESLLLGRGGSIRLPPSLLTSPAMPRAMHPPHVPPALMHSEARDTAGANTSAGLGIVGVEAEGGVPAAAHVKSTPFSPPSVMPMSPVGPDGPTRAALGASLRRNCESSVRGVGSPAQQSLGAASLREAMPRRSSISAMQSGFCGGTSVRSTARVGAAYGSAMVPAALSPTSCALMGPVTTEELAPNVPALTISVRGAPGQATYRGMPALVAIKIIKSDQDSETQAAFEFNVVQRLRAGGVMQPSSSSTSSTSSTYTDDENDAEDDDVVSHGETGGLPADSRQNAHGASNTRHGHKDRYASDFHGDLHSDDGDVRPALHHPATFDPSTLFEHPAPPPRAGELSVGDPSCLSFESSAHPSRAQSIGWMTPPAGPVDAQVPSPPPPPIPTAPPQRPPALVIADPEERGEARTSNPPTIGDAKSTPSLRGVGGGPASPDEVKKTAGPSAALMLGSPVSQETTMSLGSGDPTAGPTPAPSLTSTSAPVVAIGHRSPHDIATAHGTPNALIVDAAHPLMSHGSLSQDEPHVEHRPRHDGAPHRGSSGFAEWGAAGHSDFRTSSSSFALIEAAADAAPQRGTHGESATPTTAARQLPPLASPVIDRNVEGGTPVGSTVEARGISVLPRTAVPLSSVRGSSDSASISSVSKTTIPKTATESMSMAGQRVLVSPTSAASRSSAAGARSSDTSGQSIVLSANIAHPNVSVMSDGGTATETASTATTGTGMGAASRGGERRNYFASVDDDREAMASDAADRSRDSVAGAAGAVAGGGAGASARHRVKALSPAGHSAVPPLAVFSPAFSDTRAPASASASASASDKTSGRAPKPNQHLSRPSVDVSPQGPQGLGLTPRRPMDAISPAGGKALQLSIRSLHALSGPSAAGMGAAGRRLSIGSSMIGTPRVGVATSPAALGPASAGLMSILSPSASPAANAAISSAASNAAVLAASGVFAAMHGTSLDNAGSPRGDAMSLGGSTHPSLVCRRVSLSANLSPLGPGSNAVAVGEMLASSLLERSTRSVRPHGGPNGRRKSSNNAATTATTHSASFSTQRTSKSDPALPLDAPDSVRVNGHEQQKGDNKGRDDGEPLTASEAEVAASNVANGGPSRPSQQQRRRQAKKPKTDPRSELLVKSLGNGYSLGHFCIVFEVLGANLFEVIKANGYRGLGIDAVKELGKQLLEALSFIHEKGILHCDVKPENILVVPPKPNSAWGSSSDSSSPLSATSLSGSCRSNDGKQTQRSTTRGKKNGSDIKAKSSEEDSDFTDEDEETQSPLGDVHGGAADGGAAAVAAAAAGGVFGTYRRHQRMTSRGVGKKGGKGGKEAVPSDPHNRHHHHHHVKAKKKKQATKPKYTPAKQATIRLIDFGLACDTGGEISTYHQTRYYRAPEVILGGPTGPSIDVWSVGCVLAELFFGLPLLPGDNDYQQLQLIEEMLGPVPARLLRRSHYSDLYYCRRQAHDEPEPPNEPQPTDSFLAEKPWLKFAAEEKKREEEAAAAANSAPANATAQVKAICEHDEHVDDGGGHGTAERSPSSQMHDALSLASSAAVTPRRSATAVAELRRPSAAGHSSDGLSLQSGSNTPQSTRRLSADAHQHPHQQQEQGFNAATTTEPGHQGLGQEDHGNQEDRGGGGDVYQDSQQNAALPSFGQSNTSDACTMAAAARSGSTTAAGPLSAGGPQSTSTGTAAGGSSAATLPQLPASAALSLAGDQPLNSQAQVQAQGPTPATGITRSSAPDVMAPGLLRQVSDTPTSTSNPALPTSSGSPYNYSGTTMPPWTPVLPQGSFASGNCLAGQMAGQMAALSPQSAAGDGVRSMPGASPFAAVPAPAMTSTTPPSTVSASTAETSPMARAGPATGHDGGNVPDLSRCLQQQSQPFSQQQQMPQMSQQQWQYNQGQSAVGGQHMMNAHQAPQGPFGQAGFNTMAAPYQQQQPQQQFQPQQGQQQFQAPFPPQQPQQAPPPSWGMQPPPQGLQQQHFGNGGPYGNGLPQMMGGQGGGYPSQQGGQVQAGLPNLQQLNAGYGASYQSPQYGQYQQNPQQQQPPFGQPPGGGYGGQMQHQQQQWEHGLHHQQQQQQPWAQSAPQFQQFDQSHQPQFQQHSGGAPLPQGGPYGGMAMAPQPQPFGQQFQPQQLPQQQGTAPSFNSAQGPVPVPGGLHMQQPQQPTPEALAAAQQLLGVFMQQGPASTTTTTPAVEPDAASSPPALRSQTSPPETVPRSSVSAAPPTASAGTPLISLPTWAAPADAPIHTKPESAAPPAGDAPRSCAADDQPKNNEAAAFDPPGPAEHHAAHDRVEAAEEQQHHNGAGDDGQQQEQQEDDMPSHSMLSRQGKADQFTLRDEDGFCMIAGIPKPPPPQRYFCFTELRPLVLNYDLSACEMETARAVTDLVEQLPAEAVDDLTRNTAASSRGAGAHSPGHTLESDNDAAKKCVRGGLDTEADGSTVLGRNAATEGFAPAALAVMCRQRNLFIDLLQRLLAPDPADRISTSEALMHSFFTEEAFDFEAAAMALRDDADDALVL